MKQTAQRITLDEAFDFAGFVWANVTEKYVNGKYINQMGQERSIGELYEAWRKYPKSTSSLSPSEGEEKPQGEWRKDVEGQSIHDKIEPYIRELKTKVVQLEGERGATPPIPASAEGEEWEKKVVDWIYSRPSWPNQLELVAWISTEIVSPLQQRLTALKEENRTRKDEWLELRRRIVDDRNLAHVNCLEAEKNTYNLVLTIMDSIAASEENRRLLSGEE